MWFAFPTTARGVLAWCFWKLVDDLKKKVGCR